MTIKGDLSTNAQALLLYIYKQEEMMSDKENKAIIEVFRELEQGYKQGDVDRCIATFYEENVSMIGTAVDEVRLGNEEVRYQLQRDIEQTSFRDLSFSEFQFFFQLHQLFQVKL